ncbi:dihydroxyacetone kinase subunit DhaK [Sinorhizobium sp. BG8]|uniref:dihydroxyacetone kinase subunit DhaK n=1 Tax=Sinorhizobium sp. BG8 TaxID=2613773 RepID=UPI00193E2738|nr:dihydroxyacetone kinase subunit DhaK [Sinorhizobium sp. BG8]QRM54311.1 dihydroxyacetone kinase subunit DhaK [Sinorhizobium sp. BG8]
MKKFINSPEAMVLESLRGFVAANADLVAFGAQEKYVRRSALKQGKVAIVSGGGAGHEPMHSGFVGHGMLDAACTGHVFTSPTPDQILAAVEGTETGAGTLLIVKNYDGDVMNFEMAAEMAVAREGRSVATIIVSDDIAVHDARRSSGRRGVAGTLVVEKILGAAAEAGMDLSSLVKLGEAVVRDTRTMGVALRGATVPDTARETFVLGPDEMEVGVGIHGEPGRSREAFGDAEAIVAMVCQSILADLDEGMAGEFLLLVNGFGGTPVSELYLVYGIARRIFESCGLTVGRSLVGTYVTSLDMAGMSITLSLLDGERKRLWDAPVATPALRWGI